MNDSEKEARSGKQMRKDERMIDRTASEGRAKA